MSTPRRTTRLLTLQCRMIAVALAGLISMLGPFETPAADSAAIVEQPRSYGHVLGDVLSQRVSLDDGAGKAEIPILPAAARVNTWFERLPSRLEKDARGHSWLRIDYQLVNAPRDLQMAALPALTLAMKSGSSKVVPEWPVSIAPLTPDEVYGKGDLQAMRPDHAAVPYPTGRAGRQLEVWASLSLLAISVWLGWFFWRNLRDANRMPFARAAREVRGLQRSGAPGGSEGWVSLHRAFNAAAGRVIQAESLPRLFERAPYLEPLRPDIEGFYAASSERFFARTPGSSPVRLDEFSRRLRNAEKQRGTSRGA